MSTWYRLSLGDGMTSGALATEIEEAFSRLPTTPTRPSEIAVFTRPESEDRLHCEVMAYFSPAAADVAKAFDAEPCTRPARAGLSLLVGDENSWSVLFAEDRSVP
jgi:hypothetical protein